MRYFYLLVFLVGAQVLPAQCFEDRHSTSWMDGWKSCTPAPNPNPVYGESHWIRYNLDGLYSLHETHFWNYNDPKFLKDGAQKIAIDVSQDGESWISMGTYELGGATGLATYEGTEGPDLNGVEARFILITIAHNHGGECYGLGEFKVKVKPADSEEELVCFRVNAFPNPFDELINVMLDSPNEGNFQWRLYNSMSQVVAQGMLADQGGAFQTQISVPGQPGGFYSLVIQQGDCQKAITLISN